MTKKLEKLFVTDDDRASARECRFLGFAGKEAEGNTLCGIVEESVDKKIPRFFVRNGVPNANSGFNVIPQARIQPLIFEFKSLNPIFHRNGELFFPKLALPEMTNLFFVQV
jgi:hypothetical protein